VKAAVVVTTIHDCSVLLDGYLRNFAKYGHEVKFYLIPDLKTPKFVVPNSVCVPDKGEQVQFLWNVGLHPENIPWNSDNRRNVGYLMALADGAEMVVSIDDDNYCREEKDFIGEHWEAIHGVHGSIHSPSGWLNNCDLFNENIVYPRGFPYYPRGNLTWEYSTSIIAVHINSGMWIGEPDLDAMTWLHNPMYTVHCQGEVVLALDTWSPVNSQNTAVHRDLMGAYYFVRMVPPVDRFGDIFQGYFALKVAKYMGWTVRFGSPVVEHRRNSHNYLADAQAEIPAIRMLEELLPKLLETKLTGTTVEEAYLSLADFVESQASPFYSETARLMRMWSETVGRINGKSYSSRGA
jgi:Reversibly glycosylated polypeptide